MPRPVRMHEPDTDFQASLYEILADGKSVLLTSDFLRARYRDSLEKESLVPKGEIVRYEFTDFSWFSRRISPRGSGVPPRSWGMLRWQYG